MKAAGCTSSASRRYESRRIAVSSSRRATNGRAPRRGLRASVWLAARSLAFSSSRSTLSSSPRRGATGRGSRRLKRARRVNANARLPAAASAAPAAQDLQALAYAPERGGGSHQAAGRGQDDLLNDIVRPVDHLNRLPPHAVHTTPLHR